MLQDTNRMQIDNVIYYYKLTFHLPGFNEIIHIRFLLRLPQI